jgi:hypothetical protein
LSTKILDDTAERVETSTKVPYDDYHRQSVTKSSVHRNKVTLVESTNLYVGIATRFPRPKKESEVLSDLKKH